MLMKCVPKTLIIKKEKKKELHMHYNIELPPWSGHLSAVTFILLLEK